MHHHSRGDHHDKSRPADPQATSGMHTSAPSAPVPTWRRSAALFPMLRTNFCSPVSGPVSYVPRIAPAAITFAWDLVMLRAPIAVGAPPKVA